MAKAYAGVVDCAIFESSKEYIGIASVTLPDITNKVSTISGAGIGGDIDVPIMGVKEAMRVTFEFTDNQGAVDRLAIEKLHTLDCRVVHEKINTVNGKIDNEKIKYLIQCMPIKQSEGSIAPASAQTSSIEMSVISLKKFINGTLVRHVDPLNYIDKDKTGSNRLAEVKRALGR